MREPEIEQKNEKKKRITRRKIPGLLKEIRIPQRTVKRRDLRILPIHGTGSVHRPDRGEVIAAEEITIIKILLQKMTDGQIKRMKETGNIGRVRRVIIL